VRLIDSGRLLGKPLSDLHLLPSSEELDCEALSSVASVSGIVPAGGSKTWGMTAKELMKELLEGCESCQVVPKVTVILYSVYVILYNVCVILYSVYVILYSVYVILYSVYVILYSVYVILYSVYVILYRVCVSYYTVCM